MKMNLRYPIHSGVPLLHCAGPLVIDKQLRLTDGSVHWNLGGNALICSTISARLGLRTQIIGQVGDDKDGDSILHFLKSNDVDVGKIKVLQGVRTKVCLISVGPKGEWCSKPTAFDYFPFLDECSCSVFEPCDHFHIAGVGSLLRWVPSATVRLVEMYRHAGVPVSFGLNRFTARERIRFLKIISDKDLVFCSLSEFSQLIGKKIQTKQQCLQALVLSRFKNFVVTLGPDGAVVKWNNKLLMEAESLRVAGVNTVGAGDVFASAFIRNLLIQRSVEESLRAAIVCSSLSVSCSRWDAWLLSQQSFNETIERHSHRVKIRTVGQEQTWLTHRGGEL